MVELVELVQFWLLMFFLIVIGLAVSLTIHGNREAKAKEKSKYSVAYLLSQIKDLEKLESQNFKEGKDFPYEVKESLRQLSIYDLKYLKEILVKVKKDERVSTMASNIIEIIIATIDEKNRR